MEEHPKKKKLRYFQVYILKVLKNISSRHGITLNAKEQLNSALCTITDIIAKKSYSLCSIAEKKTIGMKEVENAFFLLSSGALRKKGIEAGNKAVENFEKFDEKTTHTSRQTKAGIVFPPSLLERFLRIHSEVMIAGTAPVFLASVIEYILREILIKAATGVLTHVRLTIRDIELAIRTDTELDRLFRLASIKFLGGGVVPEIEKALLVKKPRKPKKKQTSIFPDRKSHRFRPGTVSLREIKKFQKNSERLILPRTFIEKLVRDMLTELGWTAGMISKDTFTVLQYYIEGYIVDFLVKANKLAIHSKRIKVLTTDLAFVTYLNGDSRHTNE